MGNKKRAKKPRNPSLKLNAKASHFESCTNEEEVMAQALYLADGRSLEEKAQIGRLALDQIKGYMGLDLFESINASMAKVKAQASQQMQVDYDKAGLPDPSGLEFEPGQGGVTNG